MDKVDRAADREQEILDQSIQGARGNTEATVDDSEIDCIDCGESIPQARREAVPGCLRCIDCQERKDKHDSGYA